VRNPAKSLNSTLDDPNVAAAVIRRGPGGASDDVAAAVIRRGPGGASDDVAAAVIWRGPGGAEERARSVPAPTIRAKTNTVRMVAQKTVILRFIDPSFENDNSKSSDLSTLGDNALRITP
jgi:hypothetical protein